MYKHQSAYEGSYFAGSGNMSAYVCIDASTHQFSQIINCVRDMANR